MTRNEIMEALKNGVSEIFNDAIVDVTVYKKNNAQKKIGIITISTTLKLLLSSTSTI